MEYNQIMKDQLQADVIEKLEHHITEHKAGQVHYLPHRHLPHCPVIRNDRQKSKVRIFYDVSLKIGNSSSLNDCFHVHHKLKVYLVY